MRAKSKKKQLRRRSLVQGNALEIQARLPPRKRRQSQLSDSPRDHLPDPTASTTTTVTYYNDPTVKEELTKKAVLDILEGRRALQDHTPGTNYYVIAKNGRRIGPKAIVHTILGYAHHGHAAARALMNLGFAVHAKSITPTQRKTFGRYIERGLLIV